MRLRLDNFPVTPAWQDPDLDVEVVKWAGPSRASAHVARGRFSVSPGGTWGRGVYLAAARTSLSAAHYGQAAVLARLRLGRVFDATRPENMRAFLEWAGLGSEPRAWVLPGSWTSQADGFKQILVPPPDTVVFHPDEWNPHTRPDDVWFLAWSPELADQADALDWQNPRISGLELYLGISGRFVGSSGATVKGTYSRQGGSASVDGPGRVIISP